MCGFHTQCVMVGRSGSIFFLFKEFAQFTSLENFNPVFAVMLSNTKWLLKYFAITITELLSHDLCDVSMMTTTSLDSRLIILQVVVSFAELKTMLLCMWSMIKCSGLRKRQILGGPMYSFWVTFPALSVYLGLHIYCLFVFLEDRLKLSLMIIKCKYVYWPPSPQKNKKKTIPAPPLPLWDNSPVVRFPLNLSVDCIHLANYDSSNWIKIILL